MATSRFSNYQVLENNLQPFQLPVKELAVALDAQQQRYDKGSAIEDDLRNLSINALQSQRARANTIIDNVHTQVDDVVGKFDGNMARGYSALRKLESEVKRQWNPGGEAHTIGKNYTDFTADMERQSKRKDINSSQLAAYKKYKLDEFAQKADFDEATGGYKSISQSLENVAASVDLPTKAFDIASKVVPQTLAQEGYRYSEEFKGYIIGEGEEITMVSADRIQQIVDRAMYGDPATRNYVEQTLRFKGIEPTAENVAGALKGYGALAAQAYQRNDVKRTQDLKADQVYMAGLNDRYARGRMRYKYKLKEDYDLAQVKASVQQRYSRNVTIGKPKEIESPFAQPHRLNIGNKPHQTFSPQGHLGILEMFVDKVFGAGSVTAKQAVTAVTDGGSTGNKTVDLAIRQLQDEGYQFKGKSQGEVAELIKSRANKYINDNSQGQALITAYGEKMMDNITETDIRSGVFRQQTMDYIDKYGTVHEGKTISEIESLGDVNADELQKDGRSQGYYTGLAGTGNGQLMGHPDMEGQIIIRETSIFGDKQMAPIRQMSQVLDPNVDLVEDIDLSPFINDDRLLRDANGTPLRYSSRGRNIKTPNGYVREITIHDANGDIVNKRNKNGNLVPVKPEDFLQEATTRMIMSGIGGISNIHSGKPVIIDPTINN